ncbi:aldo/keto reductase [Streptomyces sp. HSW2009]|uniref:aldo/keto reductase n=1 Tax=Streptomyces sp. HSW2009 TaxID=3142890 RepID=UPI0032ED85EB
MRYRTMGRLGWQVSEIGYGMWGIAGGPGGFAAGADYELAPQCLDEAIEQGCTFFDTAWAYGRGVSELLLGAALRRNRGRELRVATKVPPKNRQWPPGPDDTLDDVFPTDHILDYTRRSLDNLGVDRIDLLQLHGWEDRWADDPRWQEAVARLKDEGLVAGFGLSVNRWEPANCLAALDTGLVDAVQVIYNVFDQAPEDELFERAQRHGVAIIARVPFDEGTLTGAVTADSTWPEEDWRATYFGPENLLPSVERAERVKKDVPEGMPLPELALRFVLQHPAVTTVIPGMRQLAHVRSNLAVSDGRPLDDELVARLRAHRWDREPAWWSG